MLQDVRSIMKTLSLLSPILILTRLLVQSHLEFVAKRRSSDWVQSDGRLSLSYPDYDPVYH